MVCTGQGAGLDAMKPRLQRSTRPATRYQNGRELENGDHEPVNGEGKTSAAGRVDLSKLKVVSLRKYSRVYELNTVSSSSTKEELCAAVKEHFANHRVDESDVLYNLSQRKKEQQRGN